MNRGQHLVKLALGQKDFSLEQPSPKKALLQPSPKRQPLWSIENVPSIVKTTNGSIPNYVEAFDMGRWEELDGYLRSSIKISPNDRPTKASTEFPEDAMVFTVTPTGQLEPLNQLAQQWTPQNEPKKNIKRKRLFQEECFGAQNCNSNTNCLQGSENENLSVKPISRAENDVESQLNVNTSQNNWRELVVLKQDVNKSIGQENPLSNPICLLQDDIESQMNPNTNQNDFGVDLEAHEQGTHEQDDEKFIGTQTEPLQKKKRRWDRRNYCLYCEKLITNFSRHMLKIHITEEPVLRYSAVMDENLKLRKQRRQEIFDELRKKGNFLYNQSIVRESLTPPTSTMLLPVKRRAVNATKTNIDENIICKMCSGYFCRKTFYKHVKVCKMSEQCTEEQIEGNKNYAIKEQGLEIRIFSEEANDLMKDKIFPLLRKDDKGIAAMNDPLIVSVGCDFLSNHLDLKDRYNITSHMRDAGILLLKMKEKDPSILSLKDCLQSNQLDNLTVAVQEICKHDSLTGQVGVVGGPARLAWVIKECTARMLDDTVSSKTISENYKQIIKGQIIDFQMLIKRRWKYIVSTNAEKTRKKNAMKKEIIMPDNDDIKTFLTEVTFIEQTYSQKLMKEINSHSYERLCEAVIAKLIVLNRRRSGEVANAELEFYLKRPSKGTVSQEILDQLTEDEAQAFVTFDMMIIPGKIIRAVPILMTKDTARNIDRIISCRKPLHIPETNKLLFPRPGTENPFVGSQVMRVIRQSMELKKPNHLTATGLRHHCATMSHYSDKTLDKEDLAEHMGHTLETHKRKYRFPLEVVQKSVIAPHLVKLGGFSIESMPQATSPDMSTDDDPTHNDLMRCQATSDSDSDVSDKPNVRKLQRRRWSEEEKIVVIQAFQEFIKCCSNPGSKLCRALIEKEPLLKGRTWAQVNVLIDNYNKGKLSLPLQFRYLRS